MCDATEDPQVASPQKSLSTIASSSLQSPSIQISPSPQHTLSSPSKAPHPRVTLSLPSIAGTGSLDDDTPAPASSSPSKRRTQRFKSLTVSFQDSPSEPFTVTDDDQSSPHCGSTRFKKPPLYINTSMLGDFQSCADGACTPKMCRTTNSTTSRVSVRPPPERILQMPEGLMWLVVLSIGTLVGVVNFVMVFGSELFVEWKFATVEQAVLEYDFMGALLLPVYCASLCLFASVLVSFLAPMAGGSGLPEVKGYLNGYAMPGLFRTRKHWIRVVGIMLAVAAGLPVGREGPMVCIGGSCGLWLVQHLLKRKFLRDVNVLDESGRRSLNLLHDEEYSRLKRIGCTLGASCGVAVAFHAPIGGVLYMIEEVAGVFKWTPQITFQAFVGTGISVLVSTALLEISHYEFHHLVLFRARTGSDARIWGPLDIVFVVTMGALCGCLSALFTSVKIKIWKFRSSLAWRKYRSLCVLEVCVWALIVGMVWACAPLILPCQPTPMLSCEPKTLQDAFHKTTSIDRHLEGNGTSHGHARKFIDFQCDDGYFNELASFLWNGEEKAVTHLYARGCSQVKMLAAFLTLMMYMPLAMSMAGLAIPMGMFIPNLFMGACVGRIIGEGLKLAGLSVAHPGVYAFIGSGAMLGGFTHMTIAIVALLVEVTDDTSATLPLVIGVAVGRLVSQLFHHHPYDEQLVILKKVPLLGADLPPCLARSTLQARHVTRPLPDKVYLQLRMNDSDVIRLLNREPMMDFFPVYDGKKFVATCPRGRLEDIVSESQRTQDEYYAAFPSGRMAVSGNEMTHRTIVPVEDIMDSNPFCCLSNMPLSKLYTIVVNSGSQCCGVLGADGELIGLLTRADLLEAVTAAYDD